MEIEETPIQRPRNVNDAVRKDQDVEVPGALLIHKKKIHLTFDPGHFLCFRGLSVAPDCFGVNLVRACWE